MVKIICHKCNQLLRLCTIGEDFYECYINLVIFVRMKIENMKNLTVLFFSLAVMLCFPVHLPAQVKQNMEMASAARVGDRVELTLTSQKPFFVGGNRYILYIGDKEFYLNKQSARNGRGTLTFLIPADDFNDLNDGGAVYLTYGKVFRNDDAQDREGMSKLSPMCWSLGKLNKSMLTK